ncbi:MAG: thiamine ABC transporter substrate-binding protein [Candidatus Limnocylindrales bacterium]
MNRTVATSVALSLAVAVIVGGCTGPSSSPTPPASATPANSGTLTVMTHDSFALSEETLASFEAANGVSIEILRSGDAGSLVNQAVLSKAHPLADVLYGVDNAFLSRALEADIFTPYDSPALADVPAVYQVDARKRVTPIDFGDVCLNVDRTAFAVGTPAAPQTLDDLVKPDYAGRLVVENPATSSPGLAFLLATIARYGDTGATTWRDYWAGLRDNDVLVTDGWENAYNGRFSAGPGEGDRQIVVSYASSPAAEVYFADPQPAEAPTAAVLSGCFRQIEFAGILAGTRKEPGARAFIDFLLSRPVQEEIPLQMFVYPVRGDAVLPDVFQRFAAVAPDPLTMPFDVIGRNRDRWIAEWTDIVLH